MSTERKNPIESSLSETLCSRLNAQLRDVLQSRYGNVANSLSVYVSIKSGKSNPTFVGELAKAIASYENSSRGSARDASDPGRRERVDRSGVHSPKDNVQTAKASPKSSSASVETSADAAPQDDSRGTRRRRTRKRGKATTKRECDVSEGEKHLGSVPETEYKSDRLTDVRSGTSKEHVDVPHNSNNDACSHDSTTSGLDGGAALGAVGGDIVPLGKIEGGHYKPKTQHERRVGKFHQYPGRFGNPEDERLLSLVNLRRNGLLANIDTHLVIAAVNKFIDNYDFPKARAVVRAVLGDGHNAKIILGIFPDGAFRDQKLVVPKDLESEIVVPDLEFIEIDEDNIGSTPLLIILEAATHWVTMLEGV